MKLSSIVCASFVALAAFAMMAGGAQSVVNTSRSNIKFPSDGGGNCGWSNYPPCPQHLQFRVIGGGEVPLKAVKACTDKGGKVETDKDGAKFCRRMNLSQPTEYLETNKGHGTTQPAPTPATAPAKTPSPY